MDLARYADSSGYEADRPRKIWHYRDWVIDALNQDHPVSEFVIEQFGGDLLPQATDESRVATGFHCNAMLDPGVRHEAVLDRVNVTGSVFLGLTLGCARAMTKRIRSLKRNIINFTPSLTRPVHIPWIWLRRIERTASKTE